MSSVRKWPQIWTDTCFEKIPHLQLALPIMPLCLYLLMDTSVFFQIFPNCLLQLEKEKFGGHNSLQNMMTTVVTTIFPRTPLSLLAFCFPCFFSFLLGDHQLPLMYDTAPPSASQSKPLGDSSADLSLEAFSTLFYAVSKCWLWCLFLLLDKVLSQFNWKNLQTTNLWLFWS